MSISVTGAKVRIIDDMKKFLNDVSENDEMRAEYVESPKDFTRNRLLPFSTMAMFILNAPKRTLQVELNSFSDCCVPGEPCSKQAFSERRDKLKPKFFTSWNDVLLSSFYRHYGEDAKRWKGRILCAVDGCTLELPDTKSFRLMYILKRKGAKFVIRLPRNANKTVENFFKSPDSDIIAKWEPSPRSTGRLREAGYSLDITITNYKINPYA